MKIIASLSRLAFTWALVTSFACMDVSPLGNKTNEFQTIHLLLNYSSLDNLSCANFPIASLR